MDSDLIVRDGSPRILTVYAHPDDESFGPAAALAKYARNGAVVFGLFFSRGHHGKTAAEIEPSAEQLANLREQDLRDAADLIGFSNLDLLDYEDNRLGEVPQQELAEQVMLAIRRYRPEVVLTFGPGGITRHPDHLAIHQAAKNAFHRARDEGLGVQELHYDAVSGEAAKEMDLVGLPDGQPNVWIDVANTQPIKIDALRIHARHMADAREMIDRLEREPTTEATFYRSWPVVPPGMRISGFLAESSE